MSSNQFTRRGWLKSMGMAGGAALVGIPSLTNAEIEKFHPRSLATPVRLKSNENPYGPSEKVRKAMRDSFSYSCRYPYDYVDELESILAKKEGVTPEHIVVTAGSTEGLRITGLTFGIDESEIIAAKPTFLAMMTYAQKWGASVNWVPVDESMGHDLEEMEKRINNKTKLVFVCNPNNPTSTLLPKDQLRDFFDSASKKTTIFSDEAYYDYIEDKSYPSMIEFVKKDRNVIVSRTFSKVYGMAGLRVGYLIAKPEIASLLRENRVALASVPAVQGAKVALEDEEFYQFSLKKTVEAKQMIYSVLDELEMEYIDSQTNFIFFRSGREIQTLQNQMLKENVLIGRSFPPFTQWCRISTGTLEEVQVFCNAIRKIYS